MIGQGLFCKAIKLSGLGVLHDFFVELHHVRFPLVVHIGTARANDQYRFAIGNSSAGNSVITRQPLSVTTTSSSMRAAE
jgi:hypothetical protein